MQATHHWMMMRVVPATLVAHRIAKIVSVGRRIVTICTEAMFAIYCGTPGKGASDCEAIWTSCK